MVSVEYSNPFRSDLIQSRHHTCIKHCIVKCENRLKLSLTGIERMVLVCCERNVQKGITNDGANNHCDGTANNSNNENQKHDGKKEC